MRIARWLPLLVVVALIGVLGGPAAAKTNRLVATFEGDTNASLSLKIKTNAKGKPKIATAIRYGDVPISCDGVIREVSGTVPSKNLTTVDGGPYFNTHAEADGNYVSVIGFLNKKGTKVVRGEVNTIDTTAADCVENTILEFTAK